MTNFFSNRSWVENIVGKGQNVEQKNVFPFFKICSTGQLKQKSFGKMKEHNVATTLIMFLTAQSQLLTKRKALKTIRKKEKMLVISLPNDKILDWSKLKAFTYDKIKVLRIIIFILDRVENTVGKGENAGYQYFLLFPQCFQKTFYLGSLKIRIVWYRVNKHFLLFPQCLIPYLRGKS